MVVGESVGVRRVCVGNFVGERVGDAVVGDAVVGDAVVGDAVVGDFVGDFVGDKVGDFVGASVITGACVDVVLL
jgi:hypothetical protein